MFELWTILLLAPVVALFAWLLFKHSHNWEVVYHSPDWPITMYKRGVMGPTGEAWDDEGHLYYAQCSECGEKRAYIEKFGMKNREDPGIVRMEIEEALEHGDVRIIQVNEEIDP